MEPECKLLCEYLQHLPPASQSNTAKYVKYWTNLDRQVNVCGGFERVKELLKKIKNMPDYDMQAVQNNFVIFMNNKTHLIKPPNVMERNCPKEYDIYSFENIGLAKHEAKRIKPHNRNEHYRNNVPARKTFTTKTKYKSQMKLRTAYSKRNSSEANTSVPLARKCQNAEKSISLLEVLQTQLQYPSTISECDNIETRSNNIDLIERSINSSGNAMDVTLGDLSDVFMYQPSSENINSTSIYQRYFKNGNENVCADNHNTKELSNVSKYSSNDNEFDDVLSEFKKRVANSMGSAYDDVSESCNVEIKELEETIFAIIEVTNSLKDYDEGLKTAYFEYKNKIQNLQEGLHKLTTKLDDLMLELGNIKAQKEKHTNEMESKYLNEMNNRRKMASDIRQICWQDYLMYIINNFAQKVKSLTLLDNA